MQWEVNFRQMRNFDQSVYVHFKFFIFMWVLKGIILSILGNGFSDPNRIIRKLGAWFTFRLPSRLCMRWWCWAYRKIFQISPKTQFMFQWPILRILTGRLNSKSIMTSLQHYCIVSLFSIINFEFDTFIKKK